MRKLSIILLFIFTLVIGISYVNAQSTSASSVSNATARIINPITLTNVNDLSFGNIASSNSVGYVMISTSGVRTSSGGVTPSAIGSFKNASYTAGGEANATYVITLPTSISISNGIQTMIVDNFISNPSGTGTLDGNGSQTIDVGATLNVGANQPVGNYTGSYNVTIAYN